MSYVYRNRWRLCFRWPVFIRRWEEDLTEPDWEEDNRRSAYHQEQGHLQGWPFCTECESHFGVGPPRKMKS